MGLLVYDISDTLSIDLYLSNGSFTGKSKITLDDSLVSYTMEMLSGYEIENKEAVALLKIRGKLYMLVIVHMEGITKVQTIHLLSADKLGSVPSPAKITPSSTSEGILDSFKSGVIASYKYSYAKAKWSTTCL